LRIDRLTTLTPTRSTALQGHAAVSQELVEWTAIAGAPAAAGGVTRCFESSRMPTPSRMILANVIRLRPIRSTGQDRYQAVNHWPESTFQVTRPRSRLIRHRLDHRRRYFSG